MQRPAVLITGSGGFLAKRILSELLDAESPLVPSRIVLLDIADQKLNIVDTRIVTYQGDIRNPNSIAAAFRGIDIVFHCAAVVDWVTTTSNLVFEVNVTGTVNVIKACEDNAVTALVYTSSVDVMIGANSDSLVDITEDLPLPEETPNGYCRSKQLGERAVMEANSERLHTAVIRPADVWGEGDVYHIGALIEQAKSGFYVTLGDGSAVCQHVYVGNCAHAHVQLARALLDGNERVQARAYLITDAPPSNFFVHFERVLRGVGLRLWPCWRLPYWLCWPLACAVELLYDTCPFLFKKRPGFSRFAVAYCCRTITYSCDRARADFSFEIKYTEDQAMNNTIAYYKRLEQTNNK